MRVAGQGAVLVPRGLGNFSPQLLGPSCQCPRAQAPRSKATVQLSLTYANINTLLLICI